MTLTERIRELAKDYIVPLVTAAVVPYALASSSRIIGIGQPQQEALLADVNERGAPTLTRARSSSELEPTLLQVLGMYAGVIPIVLSCYQRVVHQDPTPLFAITVLSNVASYLYEKRQSRKERLKPIPLNSSPADSLVDAFENLDYESQRAVVFQAVDDSTAQYATTILHLVSLQDEPNSPAYGQASRALEKRARVYQLAQRMKELVMRN